MRVVNRKDWNTTDVHVLETNGLLLLKVWSKWSSFVLNIKLPLKTFKSVLSLSQVCQVFFWAVASATIRRHYFLPDSSAFSHGLNAKFGLDRINEILAWDTYREMRRNILNWTPWVAAMHWCYSKTVLAIRHSILNIGLCNTDSPLSTLFQHWFRVLCSLQVTLCSEGTLIAVSCVSLCADVCADAGKKWLSVI